MKRARQARDAFRGRRNKLETMGVRYFNKRAQQLPAVEAEDAVHVLNERERRALRRLVRGAVIRAFVIGAASAAIVATAMVLLQPLQSGDEWNDQILYWSLVGGIGIVTAILEVSYMYWDHLRTVHSLAHHAGLRIFGDDGEVLEESAAVAAALARAALELPNPPEEVFGVNPQRELSRFRIVLITLFYKAKISLTNFVLKAVFRRMIGRAGMRTWLAYVSVPVTATWNATVSWAVLRQARIRVMGPSAVIEYVAAILDREPPMARKGRLTAMRAVGCVIVSVRDMHPNLRALLSHVRTRLTIKDEHHFDESDVFLRDLASLSHAEQTLVLRLLYLACIIDGRVMARERQLVNRALSACNRPTDSGQLRQLSRAFLVGDAAPRGTLRSIGGTLWEKSEAGSGSEAGSEHDCESGHEAGTDSDGDGD